MNKIKRCPKWSLEETAQGYCIRFRWEGTKPKINLGLGDKKKALIEAKVWMDRWWKDEQAKGEQAETKALETAQDATRHNAKEWLGRYLKREYLDKGLTPRNTAQNQTYLQTLLRLSKAEFLEDFSRENVEDALALATAEMTPKRKVNRKDTLSGWTTLNLVRSWKKWLKWLADDDLIPHRVYNKLKVAIPKAEDKKEELWYKSEFHTITELATDLDKELYSCLRYMGIDPADIKEMERGHFTKDGKKWRFIKERAKKAADKTGTYNQIVDDRALKVLLPRIKIDEDEERKIFPELDIYKDTFSFGSSFGNRNDDYWDMLTFKCSKEELTEIRKGKDYLKKVADLKTKTITRKIIRDGIEYVTDRQWSGGAKSLPDCVAYKKKRKVKLLHSLRYTFATAASESGLMDLPTLRKALGHAKDSRTLERFYDHPRSKDEQAENPLE